MESNSPILPPRIREQQKQSWQIEILIASGLILFLYHFPDYLINVLIEIEEKKIPGAEEVILFFGGYVFARILLIGFVIVLVLRALWVAFLGINSAFPLGINFKKLAYSSYFLERLKKEKNLHERVLLLEKLCSLTFSITIILTVLSFGLFTFLFLVFLAIDLIIPSISNPDLGFILLMLFLFIDLGVVDWIIFGGLRKYATISKIYYPFHKIFKWLSLSVLFDKEYLSFLSNVKRWRVYAIFLIYFFTALIISVSSIQEKLPIVKFLPNFNIDQRHWDHLPSLQKIEFSNYENYLNADTRIWSACIQSDVIRDNVLKLFIVYRKYFDRELDALFAKNKVKTEFRRRSLQKIVENDSLIQRSLAQFFVVYLDAKPIKTKSWYFARHAVTNEKGFLTYLPLDGLKSGIHTLRIFFWKNDKGKRWQKFLEQIEFYFDLR